MENLPTIYGVVIVIIIFIAIPLDNFFLAWGAIFFGVLLPVLIYLLIGTHIHIFIY